MKIGIQRQRKGIGIERTGFHSGIVGVKDKLSKDEGAKLAEKPQGQDSGKNPYLMPARR
jgi:hypothetical protein